MRRHSSLLVAILVGAALGAVFVGMLAYAARQGGQRDDLLARGFQWLRLGPVTAPLAGACLGAALGALVGWLGVKEIADLHAVSQDLGFAFQQEVSEHALAEIRQAFPGLELSAARNQMSGKRDGLDITLIDCTMFDTNRSGPAGAGQYVRKTLVFIQSDAETPKTFELNSLQQDFGFPFSLLAALFFAVTGWLRVALGSGPRSWRRFQRDYEVRWLGRSAERHIVERLLGQQGIEFLLDHPGWSLRVAGGALAAWRDGVDETAARERPRLMQQALHIRQLLAQEPAETTSE